MSPLRSSTRKLVAQIHLLHRHHHRRPHVRALATLPAAQPHRPHPRRQLLQPQQPHPLIAAPRRSFSLLPTIVRSVLKIRYLLLGGALGGGYSLAKQYDEWKKNLPDTQFIKDLFPDVQIDKFRGSLMKTADNIKAKANEVDMDPALKRINGLRGWFEKRLDDAIQATAEQHQERNGSGSGKDGDDNDKDKKGKCSYMLRITADFA